MTAERAEHQDPRLVTVFTGPLGVAKTVQVTLGASGFLAHIPQENMKTLDPFDTGANCLSVAVQVPMSNGRAALTFLETSRVEDEAEVEVGSDLQAVARRVRWALVLQLMFFVPVPVPWFFASRYWRLVNGDAERPPGHSMTIFTLVLSALLFLVYASVFSVMWFGA